MPAVDVARIPDLEIREVCGTLAHQLPSGARIYHRHPWAQEEPSSLLILAQDLGLVELCLRGTGHETVSAWRPPVPDDAPILRVVLERSSLPRLARHLATRVGESGRRGHEALAGERLLRLRDDLDRRLDVFHAFWTPDAERNAGALALTPEQEAVREALARGSRLHVLGPPGSGKTMLAVEHALRRARQGRRVLYVCESPPLAAWVGRRVGHPDLQVADFRGLLLRAVAEGGVPLDIPQGPQRAVARFWLEDAAGVFQRALERWPERWDDVLVDQAEAFAWTWWPVVERLNAAWELGTLALFRDPGAGAGGTPLIQPATDETLTLSRNLRSPPALAALAARLQGAGAAPAGDGGALRIVTAAASPERQRRIGAVVAETLEGDGLPPEAAAIIGPRPLRNSSLLRLKSLAGHPLRDDRETWETKGGLLYADVASFRGLEADVVFLIDVDGFTPVFEREALRTAVTRARRRLVVVLADGEVAELLAGG